MAGSPDNPRDPKALRRAPATGDVVPSRPRPAKAPRELDEDPSDEDIAKLDRPTRTCPECGRDVYDDSEMCYHCGHIFGAGERGMPWLQLVVVAVLIIAFVLVFVVRLF